MYEYIFISLDTEFATGWGPVDGFRTTTDGHREIIQTWAAQGWRYVGYVPTVQGAEGRIKTIDLIFERKKEDTP